MDENTFRAPEPEDHEIPETPAATAEREDNALPGPDYIGNASSLFNFSGDPGAAENDYEEPLTRRDDSPAYPRREAAETFTDTEHPIASREGPLPPFLHRESPFEPRQVPGPSSQPSAPVPPDERLMPEKEETARKEKSGKAWWILLACGLAILAVAAAAILLFLVKGNPFAGPAGEIKVPSAMPQTEQEIVDFYRIAVNAVKKDGLAGYRKKTWQSVSTLELTGIDLVDNLFGTVFREYVTPEDRAASVVYGQGSEEAKAHFPGFTLKDLSYIKSAECVRIGDTYRITIVFQHEDTPTEKNSFLGQATDAVLFWDTQIDPVLAEISQLHAYSDVHVDYVDVTISAEIGADGRFHSMTHTAPANVTVGSARLGIFTFTDKSLQMENAAVYTDFRYY